jgi:hypothetical protein
LVQVVNNVNIRKYETPGTETLSDSELVSPAHPPSDLHLSPHISSSPHTPFPPLYSTTKTRTSPLINQHTQQRIQDAFDLAGLSDQGTAGGDVSIKGETVTQRTGDERPSVGGEVATKRASSYRKGVSGSGGVGGAGGRRPTGDWHLTAANDDSLSASQIQKLVRYLKNLVVVLIYSSS